MPAVIVPGAHLTAKLAEIAERAQLSCCRSSRGDFRAHMAVERRILADAVALGDPDSLRSLAGDYLAVRGARLASLPERAEAEALVERKEGSAQLVGYHAGLIARDGHAEDLSSHLRELLLAPHLDANVNVADRYRSQLYATGSAIGRVLDLLGAEWREGLADGASFPELLAGAVGTTWPASAPAPAAVLQRYDYHRLLAHASEYRQDDPLPGPSLTTARQSSWSVFGHRGCSTPARNRGRSRESRSTGRERP